MLGERFEWASQRLRKEIWRRYNLPDWTAADLASHKEADRMAAAVETVHVVGWDVQEVRTILGIDCEILRVDPLARRFDTDAWRPWSANDASARFLSELKRLSVGRDTAN